MRIVKTFRLDPTAPNQATLVAEEVNRLLHQGTRVTVNIAGEKELLSPQQAATWLGFSRQHVVRLIGYGEIPAEKLPHSGYWKIPLASVLAFERTRSVEGAQSSGPKSGSGAAET